MYGRQVDGSAGDTDYAAVAPAYPRYRRPDPAIAAFVAEALGRAGTVLNVGAGTGSYEPADRLVTAVEPSASMRARRPPHLAPALDATAEDLPFGDGSFDAAMSTFSVHQWGDLGAGLAELRRVTRGPVVILTGDQARLRRLWLEHDAPEVLAAEERRYPALATLAEGLGGRVRGQRVPIPLRCTDGFTEAYDGRPEMLLDPEARQACSAWSCVDGSVPPRFAEHLARDLGGGTWDARHGHLRRQATYDGSLVLVVSEPC